MEQNKLDRANELSKRIKLLDDVLNMFRNHTVELNAAYYNPILLLLSKKKHHTIRVDKNYGLVEAQELAQLICDWADHKKEVLEEELERL